MIPLPPVAVLPPGLRLRCAAVQGQILYRFPSFQVTAAQTRLSSQGRGEPAIVLEEQEKFTNASK